MTHSQDARVFLEQPVADRYDLILGDAFNDYSVPYHLTTKGFNDRVKAWLAGDGLYAVNMIDGHRGEFLRAYIHTLRQTFNYVYAAPTIAGWRESSRSTFVLVVTDTPMDRAAFGTMDGGDGDARFARRVPTKQETGDILSEGRIVTLTDQYAPVDQMPATVFRGEVIGDLDFTNRNLATRHNGESARVKRDNLVSSMIFTFHVVLSHRKLP